MGRARYPLVAALIGVGGACGRFDFDRVATGDGGPNGMTTDGDATRAGDANGTVGDATTPACGTQVVFEDGWTTAAAGAAWGVGAGVSMTTAEGGGLLKFTFGASVPANTYSSYSQATALDFTSGCMSIGLSSVPNPATDAYCYAGMIDSGNSVNFEVLSDVLYALSITNSGSTVTTIHSAPYDAAANRFVRIHELAGTYYWDTSSDGTTYVPFASAQTGLDPSALGVLVGTETQAQPVANGGTVTFLPLAVVGP